MQAVVRSRSARPAVPIVMVEPGSATCVPVSCPEPAGAMACGITP